MHYKTIVLELLRERPVLHRRLKRRRALLKTVNSLAVELKASHEACKEQIGQTRPGADASQIAAEALEIALKDLTDRLPPESPTEEEPFNLDEAMAFIRRPSPPA
jgi:hypothetical protein